MQDDVRMQARSSDSRSGSSGTGEPFQAQARRSAGHLQARGVVDLYQPQPLLLGVEQQVQAVLGQAERQVGCLGSTPALRTRGAEERSGGFRGRVMQAWEGLQEHQQSARQATVHPGWHSCVTPKRGPRHSLAAHT